MEMGTSLAISFLLLFLLGIILGVNLEDIFALRVLVLLSIWRASHFVVATTRRNGTRSMLTSAKLSVGYLVVGITRELNKEPLLH